MSAYSTDLIYFVIGLFFSAFFSGAEAVLMSIPVDRMRQLIKDGGSTGKAMEFMAHRPNEILTTILVGNNIVNIFVASLATSVAAKVFQDDAVAISVGVTTFFILIFGEIIPKSFARTHAESLAYFVVKVLQLFYYVLWIVVKPLTIFIQVFLGKNAQLNGRVITADDIEFMVEQAEKEHSIDAKQIDLLNSILEFPTIKVKDIMIPRNKISAIDVGASFKEIIHIVRDVGHSRYPVYENDMDNVLGFLHVKDLAFVQGDERKSFSLTNYLKEPFFVYEHMKVQAVFDHMNRNEVHLALIKDENDLFVGIITLEDIMEEIVGEIQDEHDLPEDEIPVGDQKIGEEGILVEGTLSLRDLYTDYDIKIPLNDNYSTITGFILDMLKDNFPKSGQIILWENYSFELKDVDNSKIETVLIRDLAETGEVKYENEVTVIKDGVESGA